MFLTNDGIEYVTIVYINFIDPEFGNYTVAALKIIHPNIHDTFQLI